MLCRPLPDKLQYLEVALEASLGCDPILGHFPATRLQCTAAAALLYVYCRTYVKVTCTMSSLPMHSGHRSKTADRWSFGSVSFVLRPLHTERPQCFHYDTTYYFILHEQPQGHMSSILATC
jgi:hypothetical protein